MNEYHYSKIFSIVCLQNKSSGAFIELLGKKDIKINIHETNPKKTQILIQILN